MEPFDVPGAGRMAVLADPSGAAWRVWQAGEFSGAQAVNEPGTWNFSDLRTRDADGAKAFYGRVLGWEVSGLDGDGGDSGGFWRSPGYGDFLAERDPDIRERMADVQAPEGFEDAIAWLVSMTSDQYPDATPPHWGITFAVDDTDAIADKATELGGARSWSADGRAVGPDDRHHRSPGSDVHGEQVRSRRSRAQGSPATEKWPPGCRSEASRSSVG